MEVILCHNKIDTKRLVNILGLTDNFYSLQNYANCSCINNFIPQNSGDPATETFNNALRNEFQNQFRTVGVEVYYDGYKFTYSSHSTESVITGQCSAECDKLILFICLLLVVVCVTSIVQMPALMTTLR